MAGETDYRIDVIGRSGVTTYGPNNLDQDSATTTAHEINCERNGEGIRAVVAKGPAPISVKRLSV